MDRSEQVELCLELLDLEEQSEELSLEIWDLGVYVITADTVTLSWLLVEQEEDELSFTSDCDNDSIVNGVDHFFHCLSLTAYGSSIPLSESSFSISLASCT